MKRLVIGFDGVPFGHLKIVDGKVIGEGPNLDALRHHAHAAAEELAYMGDESKDSAQGILDHLAERLKGRTHAHWEDNDAEG